MLKRISHISLSILLLFSTVGFAVSKHYCGDALVDIAVNENADACCDEGSCCHSETVVHTLNADFSLPQISDTPFIAEFEVLGHDLFISDEAEEEDYSKSVRNNHSPPPATVHEFLSLRQVFLL